ncbi:hypothetical protein AN958_01736 [Leucoagaricus sp. SymC.cos]|nr:hypothetical protein AN958_01736 [Leucoagaricus sp. SymC.cos]
MRWCRGGEGGRRDTKAIYIQLSYGLRGNSTEDWNLQRLWGLEQKVQSAVRPPGD